VEIDSVGIGDYFLLVSGSAMGLAHEGLQVVTALVVVLSKPSF
jgi:hypothetical protein